LSTVLLPKANVTVTADTAANGNTVVMRDSVGNLTGNNVTGSTIQTTGNQISTVSSQSASFTVDNSAVTWLVDATAAAVTVTLPSASAMTGWELWIVKKDSSANHVNLSGVSGTTAITSQYGKVKVVSDGTTIYAI